ncbi:hypothetical protein TH61_01420 [Rufibacter sp. DG15C]|uniref:hypothetical protein n=1 Tax=Rufibacter sp. DG15C TaxID=1379909 RepID=UPI00078B85BB|nr:hypothetical protein [Rufibacter sp. DG15C]AMM50104.1 hypothetical protein TH61_01420 [Rufibacter sp. DG15C]
MKKLFAILCLAGTTNFLATSCDSNTGGTTTTATQDSEHMDGAQADAVNTVPNDTTGTAATEKTQKNVGNSETRGETNTSKSSTTKNVTVGKDSVQ